MRRWSRAWIVVLALTAAGSALLSGCPARRSAGSPADLEPEFLDRA